MEDTTVMGVVTLLAVVAVAGWAAVFGLSRMLDRARDEAGLLKDELAAERQRPVPADEQAASPADPGWYSLPGGGRIELGDTGFYILLQADSALPYYLRSPEHTAIAFGGDLEGLKKLGERMAAERRQFAPVACPAARDWRSA